MKKMSFVYILIVVVAVILIVFPFSTSARGGCCSSHGGVDCEAGRDQDGSVICKDGWRDSSCSYDEVSKCSFPSESGLINKSKSSENNTNASTNSKAKSISFEFGADKLAVLSFGILLYIISKSKKSKSDPQLSVAISETNRSNGLTNHRSNTYSYYGRCPKCGGKLLYKRGKYGAFIGCENYKDFGCDYTRNI